MPHGHTGRNIAAPDTDSGARVDSSIPTFPVKVAMQQRKGSKVALAFSALVFIGIGIGVFIGARHFIDDAQQVASTHEVIGRIDDIQARMLDAESAERGYLLTGSEAYLLDYQMSVERVPVLLSNLTRALHETTPSRYATPRNWRRWHSAGCRRSSTWSTFTTGRDWNRHARRSARTPSAPPARSANRR